MNSLERIADCFDNRYVTFFDRCIIFIEILEDYLNCLIEKRHKLLLILRNMLEKN